MSKSRTTTDPDWLDNVHAGDVLMSEFMEPLELTADALAAKLGVPAVRLTAMIDGSAAVDAELDLLLGRYFAMSEGFFLRLQNAHDLLEAKRAHGTAIKSVLPRLDRASASSSARSIMS